MTELELYKEWKIKLIRQVSDDIIDQGYYCYVKDVVMPMDHESRSDYNMLATRYGEMDNPQFPLYLRTVDLGVFASFANLTELQMFMQHAFEWTVSVRLSGTTLIQQVLACTTIQQVEAISDTRTWDDFKVEE